MGRGKVVEPPKLCIEIILTKMFFSWCGSRSGSWGQEHPLVLLLSSASSHLSYLHNSVIHLLSSLIHAYIYELVFIRNFLYSTTLHSRIYLYIYYYIYILFCTVYLNTATLHC